MGERKTARAFTKFVSLNILGMVGLSCYILVDTFFVSKGLGMKGLAALNLAIVIYSLIQAMALMVGIGGATKFMILNTQGSYQEAEEVFTYCFL